MTSTEQCPLVSVLTPSYNCVAFIEETIRSVLDQDYSNLEHIVVDGGSTDGTVDILRRHPHLQWISEPDRGQSDALNKAFALSRGEIIGWLNADDLYEPATIAKVVDYFIAHPAAQVVHGNCTIFKSDGVVDRYFRGPCDQKMLHEPWRGFHGAYQPSIFYRREAIERIGGWAVDLHYVMDYDLLLRLAEFYHIEYLDADLSRFRLHSGQKGALPWYKFVREFMISIERFWYAKGLVRYWRYRVRVRDFYAMSLLEQLIQDQAGSLSAETKYLWEAIGVSPAVLRYPWVRRRCVREVLGPKLSDMIRRSLLVTKRHS